jgi:hypothetical protein
MKQKATLQPLFDQKVKLPPAKPWGNVKTNFAAVCDKSYTASPDLEGWHITIDDANSPRTRSR